MKQSPNAKLIRAYLRDDDTNPCPYSTWQRAIQGHPTRAITWRMMVRLMRAKFNRETQRSAAKRDARKRVYCGAIAYLHSELEMMNRYRF